MYKACTKCCLKMFMPTSHPFVQITNYINDKIYFILQYIDPVKGPITKQSIVFKKGLSEKLSFHRNAINIAFNVINFDLPNHPLICNNTLEVAKRSYFNVVETPSGPICVQC